MLNLVQVQCSKCPHTERWSILCPRIYWIFFVVFSEYMNFRLLWTRRASSLLVAVYIKYFVAHSWGEQFGEEEEPRLAANRKNYGTASSIGSWGHSSSCLGRAPPQSSGARSARSAPPGRLARAGFQDESTPHYNTQQPRLSRSECYCPNNAYS